MVLQIVPPFHQSPKSTALHQPRQTQDLEGFLSPAGRARSAIGSINRHGQMDGKNLRGLSFFPHFSQTYPHFIHNVALPKSIIAPLNCVFEAFFF